jgi:hypothetical protein
MYVYAAQKSHRILTQTHTGYSFLSNAERTQIIPQILLINCSFVSFVLCLILFYVQTRYMHLCEDDAAGDESRVARAALSENVNFKVSWIRISQQIILFIEPFRLIGCPGEGLAAKSAAAK